MLLFGGVGRVAWTCLERSFASITVSCCVYCLGWRIGCSPTTDLIKSTDSSRHLQSCWRMQSSALPAAALAQGDESFPMVPCDHSSDGSPSSTAALYGADALAGRNRVASCPSPVDQDSP